MDLVWGGFPGASGGYLRVEQLVTRLLSPTASTSPVDSAPRSDTPGPCQTAAAACPVVDGLRAQCLRSSASLTSWSWMASRCPFVTGGCGCPSWGSIGPSITSFPSSRTAQRSALPPVLVGLLKQCPVVEKRSLVGGMELAREVGIASDEPTRNQGWFTSGGG